MEYDRLWVASSQERDGKNKDDLIFDIFKDGIFQNTLKFDIAKGNDFYNVDDLYFFKAGKLFLVNGADATIKVYEY
jgi:hypothetical protein